MFKFIRNSGKKLLNSRGIVQLPIVIGLMLMAVALPMVANLVQKNTENRSKAAGIVDDCNTSIGCCYNDMGDLKQYKFGESIQGYSTDSSKFLLAYVPGYGSQPKLGYMCSMTGWRNGTTDTICDGHPNSTGFCVSETYLRCEWGVLVYRLDNAAACKTCTPDCSCASSLYNDQTCYDGCSANCTGTKKRSSTTTTPKATTSTPTCDSSGGDCYSKAGNGNTCEEINSSDFDFKTINVGCGSGNICCSKTAKAAPVPVVDNNKYYCSTGDVGKSQCTASTGDWAEVDNKTDNVLKKTWGSDAIGDCKNTCAATKPVSTCKTSCDAGSGLVHSAVANPNSLGGTTANSECTNSGFQNNASCKNINNGVAGCDDAFNCCSCEAKIYDCTAKACSNNYGCMRNGDFKSSTEDCANPIGTVNRTYDENCPKRNGAGGGNDDNCKNDNTSSTCTKKSLGDANCDGKVNENDYNIWIRELQKTDTTVTADFNSDGAVDGTDFSIWNKNLEK